MKRLELALKKENYHVINVSYPSTRLSIQEAAGWLDGILRKNDAEKAVRIHFVTHSLGGIVLRQYLSDRSVENLGRVVMLSPPNQGSELADKLEGNCLYKFFTGPAGQQLGIGSFGLPKRLGRANYDLGIIAGDRSLNPLFSTWICGPDDGKVSVRSTQLEGMQDFLVMHRSHTWIVWSREAAAASIQFLNHGRFVRSDGL